jgi:hypothetical protein
LGFALALFDFSAELIDVGRLIAQGADARILFSCVVGRDVGCPAQMLDA